MGVKGLYGFIEECCPDAKKNVSISQMADEHRRRYNIQPELVIDGMAILRKLYCDTLEWIYGGQWIQYIEVLKNFVNRFETIGVKLVFFFDGCVGSEKRREWCERRIANCNRMASIFRRLKNPRRPGLADVPDNIPANLGSLTALALKLICPSVTVYSSVVEGDIEVASYAKHHEAVFAILSNDTDFIIFDTKPYLCIPNLNVFTMQTVMIDRQRLSDFLSLSLKQFPLLSCLLGNDFVAKEMLGEFHSRLQDSSRVRHSLLNLPILVSRMIANYRWEGNHLNRSEIVHICNVVFGDGSNVELLRQGIAVYAELPCLSPPSNVAEWRHVNCVNISSIYSLLCCRVYGSSELLEDPTDKSLPPAALIYRPLRQRTYSILLGGRPENGSVDDIVVTEWLAYYGNNFTHPDEINPLPIQIPGGVPSLESLWEEGPFTVKLRCFMACLESPITEDMLLHLEPQYITFCCLMNYLLLYRNPPLLAHWEIAAFVAQAATLKMKSCAHIQAIQIQHVETRALHLASLFMRGVGTIIMTLGAVGYPFPLHDAMPWNYFDGKVFHEKYIQAKQGVGKGWLCENQVSTIELFDKLYHISTFGTPFSR